ncbi:MAG: class I SAM-dependent methyltransferase [Patescibacteria group bacterium]|nr:class I SAM-dependent methyltransferase [Patescibacteria group bacterium]
MCYVSMVFEERLIINKENRSNIIYDEHLVRYQLAAQIAAGKNILDIACGSGYGSKILAEAGAQKVTAVDKSPEAIAAAREKYSAGNIVFMVGDAEETHPLATTPKPLLGKEGGSPSEGGETDLADKSFNLVVSFETIEHLTNAEKYLAGIARVLDEEGIFLVSTPNREVFGQKNPYHLREFTRGEFEEILKKYFKNIYILEQTNGIASLIRAGGRGEVYFSGQSKPLYFIAVCSNNDLKLSDLFKESVVSVNPAALDKLRNNPVMKFIDKIYSIFIK